MQNNHIIIGLIGPKGSGKTTLARLLERKSFRRVPFAAPIKAMLVTLLRMQGVGIETRARMIDGDLKEIRTPFLGGRSPRHAMQTLGTEWRDLINQDLWVDIWESAALDIIKYQDVVVDDMRFLHEARRINSLEGKIVLVKREGTETDTHVSEQEYTKIPHDFIIHNDWEPQAMLDQLAHLLDREF